MVWEQSEVCVYAYVFMYIRVCIQECMYVHEYVHACAHVCTHVCMWYGWGVIMMVVMIKPVTRFSWWYMNGCPSVFYLEHLHQIPYNVSTSKHKVQYCWLQESWYGSCPSHKGLCRVPVFSVLTNQTNPWTGIHGTKFDMQDWVKAHGKYRSQLGRNLVGMDTSRPLLLGALQKSPALCTVSLSACSQIPTSQSMITIN